MSQRVQKQKNTTKTEEKVEEVKAADSKQELKDEIDDLLEEIDGLLEENAEEFVRNYVQKGANEYSPSGGQSGMMEAWKKYAPPALNFSTQTIFTPTVRSRMA